MRQKFPEGCGGPFEVPGVGRVIDGEEFEYPVLISACVPVGDAGGGTAPDADSAAQTGGPQRTRAKGTRP